MPLLTVSDLEVTYQPRRSVFGSGAPVHAVRGVDLDIDETETLGLVGESGSGKTTIGRTVLKLAEPTAGQVVFDGIDVSNARGDELRRIRREVQVVFQDPYSSLNPSMQVGEAIGEPLTFHTGIRGKDRERAVAELLDQVGLPTDAAERYPHEFSGGQRQRIAIARAIAIRPRLVVCDEAVSALDVSTQGQVINLLRELQVEFGLAYLFIAHDLAVVRHISHRIAVLYAGRLMEVGPADRVYRHPTHPYTAALLTAIPIPHPERQAERRRARLNVGAKDAVSAVPEVGCPFTPRCRYAMEECSAEAPPLYPVAGGGFSACYLHSSGTETPVEFLGLASEP